MHTAKAEQAAEEEKQMEQARIDAEKQEEIKSEIEEPTVNGHGQRRAGETDMTTDVAVDSSPCVCQCVRLHFRKRCRKCHPQP